LIIMELLFGAIIVFITVKLIGKGEKKIVQSKSPLVHKAVRVAGGLAAASLVKDAANWAHTKKNRK